jgi:hypothetical protein
MAHTHTHIRKLLAPATALIAALICLGLAACGGSSSTTASTTTVAANATPTTPSGSGAPGGPGAGRFAAMRACLQRNGVTLPAPTPGQGPRVLGGPGAGERKLPNGVTREQFQAALKKCGGGAFAGRNRRLGSPAYRDALTVYAACMKSNGVKLPTPNTSGKGPVFNSTGINTNSPQFRAAAAKCRSVLLSAFRQARPGAATGGT